MNCLKLFGKRIMSRGPDRQTAETQIRIADEPLLSPWQG